jgi:NAD(P)-dependent dehydrogenase (short-subunit alcohol dehydrogenase family)
MLAPAALAALPPTLLMGRRVVVLGSGGGLGRAVAQAARDAGAEVLGIDPRAAFGPVDALYRAGPDEAEAVAAALPDDLDALVLTPDLTEPDPAVILKHGVTGPIRLAEALAPRLPPGAAIVVRGAHGPDRAAHLPAIRAGRSLRPDDATAFAARWGLTAEPARAPLLAGWAMAAWALSRAAAWPHLRVNAITPAAPDGRLPPAQAAALGIPESEGAQIAARAAVFLISPLSMGLTGAQLATDGGLAAQTQSVHEGL